MNAFSAPSPTPGPSGPATTPDRIPRTGRAVTRRRYGGVEQVRVEVLDVPEPGAGEVLVRVGAAGLDRGALHLLTGTPLLARAAFGLRRPRQPVLGFELAGTVVAVGAGGAARSSTPALAPGDRVFGTASGAFAEYAVARPDQLAPVPEAVTDEQAATLPVSGGTALLAVEDHARVEAGQRVLVLGASGGVGGFAVQLAARRGAEVTGVCRAAKADHVRGLGAAHVVDYATTTPRDLDGPYDAVIDIAGNHPVRELRRLLTRTGALVVVGGEGGGRVLGGLHRNLAVSVLAPLTHQRLSWFVTRQTSALHARLGELVAAGEIRTPIDRTVGLDGVADALAALQHGTLRGKVAIRP
ncbi:NAD(P)-dependent alcohol dehydrogenase [Terrabacter aeriphilus]|uniref:NAD(P)-dependent alcohol dehydrogenase n=1 Tax=Terrabacter aeriphilus TaxID=515662 RepID=A0ABP9J0K4_9MICO